MKLRAVGLYLGRKEGLVGSSGMVVKGVCWWGGLFFFLAGVWVSFAFLKRGGVDPIIGKLAFEELAFWTWER